MRAGYGKSSKKNDKDEDGDGDEDGHEELTAPLNEVTLSDRTTFVDTVEALQAAVGGMVIARDAETEEERDSLLEEAIETLTDQLNDVLTNEANYGEARESLYAQLDDSKELLKTIGVIAGDEYENDANGTIESEQER